MSSNNMRVIYNNLANAATITSSVTPIGVTTIANMQKDIKSLVCRTSGTTVTFTVTFASAVMIGAVVLPFCNLTSTALIGITLSTGYTVTGVKACPWQGMGGLDYGTIPAGSNGYSYGRGTYARLWFTPTTCTSLTITITDVANTAGYLEFSRLIVGNYWMPKYNIEFGLSASVKDLTTQDRTEAGDLISNRGIRYNAMHFDLKWLTPTDRLQLTNILKGGGMFNASLISLFPDNSDDWTKEQLFMIYGKMTQLPDIVHPMYTMYTTTIDFEEI